MLYVGLPVPLRVIANSSVTYGPRPQRFADELGLRDGGDYWRIAHSRGTKSFQSQWIFNPTRSSARFLQVLAAVLAPGIFENSWFIQRNGKFKALFAIVSSSLIAHFAASSISSVTREYWKTREYLVWLAIGLHFHLHILFRINLSAASDYPRSYIPVWRGLTQSAYHCNFRLIEFSTAR